MAFSGGTGRKIYLIKVIVSYFFNLNIATINGNSYATKPINLHKNKSFTLEL